jgi:hypothetical protein
MRFKFFGRKSKRYKFLEISCDLAYEYLHHNTAAIPKQLISTALLIREMSSERLILRIALINHFTLRVSVKKFINFDGEVKTWEDEQKKSRRTVKDCFHVR